MNLIFCIALIYAFINYGTSSNIIKTCECGVGNPEEIDVRIINPREAYKHQYPWMVYLRYRYLVHCGGAIINTQYILTAAHCVWQFSKRWIHVIVGAHRSKDDGDVREISQTIIHENYTRYDGYDDNDIALLRLTEPLEFTDNIRPICLPDPDYDYSNVIAVIAGWGSMTSTGARAVLPKVLMTSEVRVIPDDVCRRSRTIGSKLFRKHNICGYGHNTDTCSGDSGTPLFYQLLPYKYEVIGVVSWGQGCGKLGVPGVYTRVTSYLDWIAENTADADYCAVTL